MTSRNAQPPTTKGRILFAESSMLVICAVAIPKSAATLSYYDDSVNGPEALVVPVPVGAILVPPYPVITPPNVKLIIFRHKIWI
jgi:hypothetical protein